jgi:hypothetical protein
MKLKRHTCLSVFPATSRKGDVMRMVARPFATAGLEPPFDLLKANL